jgi:hypothetical protein
MKKTIIYPIALIAFFASCKKRELPEEPVNSPVFYLDCDINGIPVKLNAGTDDYYMNSSYYQDTNSIYVFKSTLEQKNCSNSNCGYALTILINDRKVSNPNSRIVVDDALKPGQYMYLNHADPPLTQSVEFKPLVNFNSGAAYSWTVTDGKGDTRRFNSTNSQYSYSITSAFNVGKTYTVLFNHDDFTGSCSPTHMRKFRIGNNLQSAIVAKKDSFANLKYDFSYGVPAPGKYKCAWDFGDGSADATSSEREPSHTFTYGNYITKLTLWNEDTGDTCTSYYQVDATDGTPCQANFTAKFLPIQNTKTFSSITILLTAPDGKVYSSKDFEQGTDSRFEITKVEEYVLNEKGQQTKSLSINFNCTVKNGSTPLTITNGRAVIAAAYK